tara:strand:+ start:2789 stop:3601 length:813 start_codon:yes stop_codon:yes gene_type:complete
LNKISNFVEIKKTNKIWAIGSIHSNLNSFSSIKKYILNNFNADDILIFLGNIIGLGDDSKETLNSVLDLRFNLMSKFKLKPESIIFLRGAQEEMFSKLLQLQLAPNPSEIVNWMFEHGVNKTIISYGFSEDEVRNITTSGAIKISKWTSSLNKALYNNSGHTQYFLNLKHAAYSHTKKILFVNRGVDITRPLSAQNDCFWWGFQNFSKIQEPYNTFLRIVRGYESKHSNQLENSKNNVVCTLFKQPLTNKNILCGIFTENGDILDLFENN